MNVDVLKRAERLLAGAVIYEEEREERAMLMDILEAVFAGNVDDAFSAMLERHYGQFDLSDDRVATPES